MSLVDKVEENKANIISLLQETGREGIDGLVGWLEQSDYFTAPASSRPDFHGCHEGGLAEHSLNVYQLFRGKVAMYGLEVGDDEMAIAALLHDLCKVNTYKPNVLKSGKVSEAKPYVVKDEMPLGHGEKSVMMAGKHIELTPNEALLMRWHMAQFDGAWEVYEHKVAKSCPAVYAFQFSDHEASKYVDAKVVR
ncbi:HD domain-containing protein [Candidatus Peregrinibacteria bacterium]|jgi:23S rRNA maturation-related 3'-5' exoribonuclease YhaM|nr:HD domain-containing protein [Candidatus Woesearchaeota archaeon]MBT4698160.1 HD domain-containing protein [Candidatus Woesearchaeota archaeon]MBT4716359.1 HD domain-containing protein [Candidatus Woesearchaeota archaeon]MBT7928456.1 HD domain-containing protein [Candidatus Peregrinibacteria bacterium]MBT7930299.1 HD domain-containing protein [Candidatus Woesearchaeota archaeon]